MVIVSTPYIRSFRKRILWFSSYLKNRTQTTQVGQHISDKVIITCGVPQGSVLGPLLFLLYVNDIHKCSKKLRFYLFADDTNILYADKNVKALETTINVELQKLYVWLTANRLTLNTKKSNFIVFHPCQKQLAYQPKICMFDNEQNKYVDLESKVYMKYLGVLIDKNLSWKYHIDAIATKISKNVGLIVQSIYYFDPSQIATEGFSSPFISLKYTDQHIKNLEKFLRRGRYNFFY